MKMEVGKKYRGYGFLNEYGEFDFIPEQKGANLGKKRLVKEGDGYTFYVTDAKVILHITLDRVKDKIALLRKFGAIISELFLNVKEYEL